MKTDNDKSVLLLSEDDRKGLVDEIVSSVVIALKDAGLAAVVSHRSGDADTWGSRKDACDLIKCSMPTLHSMMNQGAIKFQKSGRRTLVNLTDLRGKLERGELAKYHRK